MPRQPPPLPHSMLRCTILTSAAWFVISALRPLSTGMPGTIPHSALELGFFRSFDDQNDLSAYVDHVLFRGRLTLDALATHWRNQPASDMNGTALRDFTSLENLVRRSQPNCAREVVGPPPVANSIGLTLRGGENPEPFVVEPSFHLAPVLRTGDSVRRFPRLSPGTLTARYCVSLTRPNQSWAIGSKAWSRPMGLKANRSTPSG
jgi:hypothetical protein